MTMAQDQNKNKTTFLRQPLLSQVHSRWYHTEAQATAGVTVFRDGAFWFSLPIAPLPAPDWASPVRCWERKKGTVNIDTALAEALTTQKHSLQ